MATTAELAQLKEKLLDKKMQEKDINKILAYISGAIRDEAAAKRKKSDAKTPVTNNTIDQLYTLIFKWWNQGLMVDGVNVVITGVNMAMVTFHGYKNKVLATYPETQFDISLVREGDTFTFAKETGSVVYTHNIADPFETTEHAIIGAYVIFKNKRGEFLETLNQSDYGKMKSASKQAYLWGQWESEFWLKSIIKRACKRHFYDVVEEIDKLDNEDYGALGALDKPPEDPGIAEKVKAAIKQIDSARDAIEATKIFQASGLMNNKEVVKAYQDKKLSFPPAVKEPAVANEHTKEDGSPLEGDKDE